MKIFFDLDGTLIDSRERLYRLFQHLVPGSTLSFGEYWRLKRNKVGHVQLLAEQFGYSDEEIRRFTSEWLSEIERPEWLAMDKPFDITDYLHRLKEEHVLYIITARQFEQNVVEQVRKYQWDGLFEKIWVTGGIGNKHELLADEVTMDNNDWLVGDTGKDIESGKRLGLHTAAVLSGFLNRERLMEYHPDVIVDNVLELKFA